jgi:hypothetical protein
MFTPQAVNRSERDPRGDQSHAGDLIQPGPLAGLFYDGGLRLRIFIAYRPFRVSKHLRLLSQSGFGPEAIHSLPTPYQGLANSAL